MFNNIENINAEQANLISHSDQISGNLIKQDSKDKLVNLSNSRTVQIGNGGSLEISTEVSNTGIDFEDLDKTLSPEKVLTIPAGGDLKFGPGTKGRLKSKSNSSSVESSESPVQSDQPSGQKSWAQSSYVNPLRHIRSYISNLKASNDQESLSPKGPKLTREERIKINRERSKPKVSDSNHSIPEVQNVKADQARIVYTDDQNFEVKNLQSVETTDELVEVLKKSINRKFSRHKKLFRNPDGSRIRTKPQFADSQLNHLKSKSTVIIHGIYLSKDHLPFDALFYFNTETNLLITVKKLKGYTQYVGPRRMSVSETDILIKHGIVGKDSVRFQDMSWIRHGMKADEIVRMSNLRENGRITDEPMDSVDAARQFSDLMSYPDSDATQEL